jgi:hypothetical protein
VHWGPVRRPASTATAIRTGKFGSIGAYLVTRREVGVVRGGGKNVAASLPTCRFGRAKRQVGKLAATFFPPPLSFDESVHQLLKAGKITPEVAEQNVRDPYLLLRWRPGDDLLALAVEALPDTAVRDRLRAVGALDPAMPVSEVGRRFGRPPLRHRFLLGRGMFSDDTEHTCMVGQALLRAPHDADAFVRSLAWRLRWWLLGLPAGTGRATLRAVLNLWLGCSRGGWSLGDVHCLVRRNPRWA